MLISSTPFDTLNVYLSSTCNFACRYCYIKRLPVQKRRFSAACLIRFVRSFLAAPGSEKNIVFSGPEPLQNFRNFKKICMSARQDASPGSRARISLVTNGSYLTDEMAAFIKDFNVDVTVSIDGSQSDHDRNRIFSDESSQSSYESCIAGVERLRKHAVTLKANLVFTARTHTRLLNNITHLYELGFHSINFMPALFEIWDNEGFAQLEQELRDFADFYISIFKEKKPVFLNDALSNFISGRAENRALVCRSVTVDYNGIAYCCDKVFALPLSERKRFAIGDVRKGINLAARNKMLGTLHREIETNMGIHCQFCSAAQHCYCPIGYYVYNSFFSKHIPDCSSQFCRISRLYIGMFRLIQSSLATDGTFLNAYA